MMVGRRKNTRMVTVDETTLPIHEWRFILKVGKERLQNVRKYKGDEHLVRFIRARQKQLANLELTEDEHNILGNLSPLKVPPTISEIEKIKAEIREEKLKKEQEETIQRLSTYRHPRTYRVSSDGRRFNGKASY